MMEEYDRLAQNQNPKSARLRLFLFQHGDDSRTSSISSLLHGSVNRDHWFFDAINGDAGALERGRSEVSSIVSEVPDYLFGLDNSEDAQPPRGGEQPKPKSRPALNDNVSVSDPGSPAPVVSSTFCSTSSSVPSVPSIPNLPPVKTKPDNSVPVFQESKEPQMEGLPETGHERPLSQPNGYPGNPTLHYVTDPRYSGHAVHPMAVYYVQGPAQPGNVPVQPYPTRAPYVQQQYPQAVSGQMPVGYHHQVPGVGQVYGGGMRPISSLDHLYDVSARVVPDGVNQQVLYGVRNGAVVSGYPGMVVQTGEEFPGTGSEVKMGRISHERNG